MRFAPTFALFSALFSTATAHAINAHRSRTLSERQYRHPRPRADLLDVCVSLNLGTVLGNEDGLLGLPLGILAGVDLCLCLKDLNIFLDTDIAVKLADLLGSKDALAAIIKAKLNTSGTQCGDLPAHAHRVCSNANPCQIGCDSGYVEQDGICVCAAPTKDCNGKCAYSCASSVPRSPEPRVITSAPQKRHVPAFPRSVFARGAKRVLHIDTCDLLNILALSDIARVQVDLPILDSLNDLLKALKLGGHPDTCPSAAKRAPPTHIDLCELLEGLSLGTIKVKADLDLGPVLNGLLNNLLSSLHLGGQNLSCHQSKSSAAASCTPSQRGLVARTTDVDLCPLLKSLGLDDILKVKVDLDGLGPVLDQLLNGLLAALGAGGFPPCGSQAPSSFAHLASDSSDIIGVVDSLVGTLVGMKSLLTSLGCGCSDGSVLSNTLDAVVVLINQLLTALGNVTDDLGEYISSLQHPLAELQCSLKSYSSMDTLPKDTSAAVNKLVSACDILLAVLDKTLDHLDSCGCKKDPQTAQTVKKHIADNPYLTSTPSHASDVASTHEQPVEQASADSSGADSEPCESDLVTELLHSVGLDNLLGTSTADLVNNLIQSLLGGGALLSGSTLGDIVDGLGLGNLLGGTGDLLQSVDDLLGGLLGGLLGTGGSNSLASSSSSGSLSSLLQVVEELLDGIAGLLPLLESLNLVPGANSAVLSEELLQQIVAAVNEVLASVSDLLSDPSQLGVALNGLIQVLDGAASSAPSTVKSTLQLTKCLVQGLVDLVDGLVDGLDSCSCMKEQGWKDGVRKRLGQKATSLGHA